MEKIKYLPLTFIRTKEQILFQIRSTILFHYIYKSFKDEIQLTDILENTQYGYTASAKSSGNAKLIRITDIQENKIDIDNLPRCECSDIEKFAVKSGDILVARTGGTTGKSFLVDEINEDNVLFASYLIRLRCNDKTLPQYVHLFLNSFIYWNQISDMKTGSAQPNVNARKLSELKIPFCPLSEQKRFIEQFNGIYKYYKDLAKNLNSIQSIFSLKNKVDLNNTHNQSYIQKLRQAILSEAVQGKLVPQDPNDEPAKKRIEELIKGRLNRYQENIKKAKSTGKRRPKKPKNIHFWEQNKDLIFNDKFTPKGWIKTYFINLCVLQRGFDLPKSQFKKGDYPVASSGGIMGYHNEYKAKGPGVFTGRSGSVGKVHYIESDYWPHNTSLFVKDFNNNFPKYVYYALKAYGLESESSSTAVATLNRNRLFNMKVNIPPYQEQIRIVNKIERLFQLVDQLESQIKENQKNSEALVNAVLREAFEV